MPKSTKKSPSWILITFFTLVALVVACAIWQLVIGDHKNVTYCLSALIMLPLPQLAQRLFRIKLPDVLELIIYIFIVAAQILGEVFNFYEFVPCWDNILHTVSGFVCAAIGFSLLNLLNPRTKSAKNIKNTKDTKNTKNIKSAKNSTSIECAITTQNAPAKLPVSPLYLGIVAICFSITIGVCWEFVEFSIDSTLRKDMQKDRIISNVSSVMLDETHTNTPVVINDIIATNIKTANNEIITIEGGFLDIGLIDTMKDLFANFIGALIFFFLSVFYIKNNYQGQLARYLLPYKPEI